MWKSISCAAFGIVVLADGVAVAQQSVGTPTMSAIKIAFVDIQRLMAESAEGKAAAAKIQALTQKKSAELQEKAKALQAAQQKLQDGGLALSDTARAKAQKDIERLNIEVARFKEDASSEVQALQQQLFQPIQEKVKPILDAMIKELGIQVLFSAAEVGTFLVDPQLDITQELIKRLDSPTSKPAKP